MTMNQVKDVIKLNGTTVICKKNEERFELSKKRIETHMVFVSAEEDSRSSVSVHFYYTKQKIMVQGTRFLKFIENFLRPLL